MSDELHKRLVQLAAADKRSLNSQILVYLELATRKPSKS